MAKKKTEAAEDEESVMLEPELEEALKNATDAEMCDIAGEKNTINTAEDIKRSYNELSFTEWVLETAWADNFTSEDFLEQDYCSKTNKQTSQL